MQIASDATLELAKRLRSSGKSWAELTREQPRRTSLDFFKGARSGKTSDKAGLTK